MAAAKKTHVLVRKITDDHTEEYSIGTLTEKRSTDGELQLMLINPTPSLGITDDDAEMSQNLLLYFEKKDYDFYKWASPSGDCPLVCLDETSKQLVAETRVPMPMKAGRPARFDYEYERNGTANLFMMFAPLEGWRHVKVTDRHTAVDYAHVLKDLADIHFVHAKTIVLVQDNLSIHSKASLYEAFSAVEARRLVERFEWHYTPKHGSWLDLAESEFGVLTSQCLDRRIPDKQTLIDEIAAWEHDRNANHTKADWQFTTKNARIRLKHLYPSI